MILAACGKKAACVPKRRGNCWRILRSKLQKLQNRAARVLTYSNYDVDADQASNSKSYGSLQVSAEVSFRLSHF